MSQPVNRQSCPFLAKTAFFEYIANLPISKTFNFYSWSYTIRFLFLLFWPHFFPT